jgi:hypothetical protein
MCKYADVQMECNVYEYADVLIYQRISILNSCYFVKQPLKSYQISTLLFNFPARF